MQPIASKITRPYHYKKLSKEVRREIQLKRSIRKQLINQHGAICALCGKPIVDMKDCTIDHIIPLSRGGLTTLENCQLAHSQCNLEKGNTCPDSVESNTITS